MRRTGLKKKKPVKTFLKYTVISCKYGCPQSAWLFLQITSFLLWHLLLYSICDTVEYIAVHNSLYNTNTHQKLCPHFVMCASSIISKQMGLKNKQKPGSSRRSQTFTELTPKLECNTKLTRRSRCFCLRMNSRDRCTVVPDAGISFCYQRTQTVCWEKLSRPGLTARRPELALTGRPLRPLQGSVRAQHFQKCSHYLWERCCHRHRLYSQCLLYYYCCCYLCWALNSPQQRFAVAGCLTSYKAD